MCDFFFFMVVLMGDKTCVFTSRVVAGVEIVKVDINLSVVIVVVVGDVCLMLVFCVLVKVFIGGLNEW